MRTPHKINSRRISVVIPTYNRGSILADTLRMLLRQDYDDYEIIVVDQSPKCSPEVEEVIAAVPEKIRYLRLNVPNLPSARNAGVRAATGDIIAFIDDDVEIGRDYLKTHARHYDDRLVGGVTGVTLSRVNTCTDVQIQATLRAHEARLVLEDGRAHLSWMVGGNTSYRKDAIVAAGMSDERFFGGACAEDADLSVRVRHLGFVLLFDPDIHLVHLEAPTGGCENRSSSETKETERLLLYAYFLLKNRRIIGTAPVLRALLGAYRRFALTRRTLLGGPIVILEKQFTFLKSLRRALSCVADSRLPVVE
jgi:glycosyltransferase involved in cell wall biosynthesis